MIITPLLVIFMIIVFVLLFLFLNTVDKRKWLTVIISLVLTPFVYFYLFYPFVNILSNYHHQKSFNEVAWQDKPSLRYEMIDNTIEDETLIGKSKKEIEQLLGKHEWLTWDDAKKAHDTDRWNYNLGTEPGAFNNQRECIELLFKSDKVVVLKPYKEEIIFDAKEQN